MQKSNSFTLLELSKLTGSEVVGNSDHEITGVDDLESANEQMASFLDNPRYEQQMLNSKAGVIFIQPSSPRAPGKNYLLHANPSLAFQQVIKLFIPKVESGFTGIHPKAVVHETAKIAEGVTIGPTAVIDNHVTIGKDSKIGAGVFVGSGASIGENCTLYPNAVVRERCVVGNRVVIQPGSVIGSCGFGFFTDQKGRHHTLEQLGNVVIEDDVEIGANTTIDRARFKSTLIKRGTKIDNLVQIAHQVQIGEDNLIVSQVGIAGSTKTGRNVVIGGQVGIVGHIVITDGVMMAARSAASKSILKAGIYSGGPAIPIKEFNEQIVYIRNLKKLVSRVKALEEKFSSETQEI
jgi:UDP-3-O-[3-hydroxymyristoyl] glucosamine N-acyltransferase